MTNRDLGLSFFHINHAAMNDSTVIAISVLFSAARYTGGELRLIYAIHSRIN